MTLHERPGPLGVASVKAVGGLRYAAVDDRQGGVGGVFQGHGHGLFLQRGEAPQHPVRQIVVRTGLGPHADFDPGEVLTPQLGDDGLNAVVASGGALRADADAAGVQRNVVEHHQNPLGRDVKIGGQLQHRPARQIHKGLGL